MRNKVKVKSPANMAFIKYWGIKDEKQMLPYNDSFSMNLSNCFSEMEVIAEEDRGKIEIYAQIYKEKNFKLSQDRDITKKINNFLNAAEKFLGLKINFGLKIYSKSSFPKKAGIAGSSSFFSGLSLALVSLLGIKISQRDLTILARLTSSGSACRSIPHGFVWWKRGDSLRSSYAYSIAPPSFWDLRDIVLISSQSEKKVTSFDGHKKATTSRFFKLRLLDLETRLKLIRKAFLKKDFSLFGELLEEDTLSMHMVIMTQKPPIYYWNGLTLELMKEVINLRSKGIEAYFTIDAGANINIICQGKDESRIINYFKNYPGIKDFIINKPAYGALLI